MVMAKHGGILGRKAGLSTEVTCRRLSLRAFCPPSRVGRSLEASRCLGRQGGFSWFSSSGGNWVATLSSGTVSIDRYSTLPTCKAECGGNMRNPYIITRIY
jgi:hypothetical protein